MENKQLKSKKLFSNSDLRIIAFSLSILSLGLAIAYIGFVIFLSK
ncbi:MAG TPA: hypothetical protein VG935_02630 [Patescibacteria group bacterium]|nr:hypothetical protein [Patescibacteria group bacterium]